MSSDKGNQSRRPGDDIGVIRNSYQPRKTEERGYQPQKPSSEPAKPPSTLQSGVSKPKSDK